MSQKGPECSGVGGRTPGRQKVTCPCPFPSYTSSNPSLAGIFCQKHSQEVTLDKQQWQGALRSRATLKGEFVLEIIRLMPRR